MEKEGERKNKVIVECVEEGCWQKRQQSECAEEGNRFNLVHGLCVKDAIERTMLWS